LVLLIVAFGLLMAATMDHSGPAPLVRSRAFILLISIVLGAAAAMITIALVLMLTNGLWRNPDNAPQIVDVDFHRGNSQWTELRVEPDVKPPRGDVPVVL